MMDILFFPVRLVGMIISFVFEFIGSIFGFVMNLVGGIFGMIFGGAFLFLMVLGVAMLIRLIVRGVRGW